MRLLDKSKTSAKNLIRTHRSSWAMFEQPLTIGRRGQPQIAEEKTELTERNTTTFSRYVDNDVTDCHRTNQADSRARIESTQHRRSLRCDLQGEGYSTQLRGSPKAGRQASAAQPGAKRKRKTKTSVNSMRIESQIQPPAYV